MIPVVLCIAVFIFTLMYFTPGDPAQVILGSSATQEELAELRETMGLNRPYIVRLANYLEDVFLHLDLGESYIRGSSITEELLSRVPRTVLLGLMCMALQIIVGVPLGMYAAYHQNRVGDRFSMLVALVGISVPQFWLALLLIMLFSVKLNWLPSFGIGGIEYYIMPCVANAFGGIAMQSRQTRSAVLEVMRADYITTARAKGLSEFKVRMKHMLPNAMITLITIIGTGLGNLLGGSLVIETVFAIPGVGTYMMSGVSNRDYPVVQGSVLVLGLYFCIVMLLVDLAYAFIDPRIKAQYQNAKGGKRRGK